MKYYPALYRDHRNEFHYLSQFRLSLFEVPATLNVINSFITLSGLKENTALGDDYYNISVIVMTQSWKITQSISLGKYLSLKY